MPVFDYKKQFQYSPIHKQRINLKKKKYNYLVYASIFSIILLSQALVHLGILTNFIKVKPVVNFACFLGAFVFFFSAYQEHKKEMALAKEETDTLEKPE